MYTLKRGLQISSAAVRLRVGDNTARLLTMSTGTS
jgi:hypothetical protein